MLSRLAIAFLPRSKHLFISWLQSKSAVILEPKKIKSVTVCIKVDVTQSSGLLPDSTVLDETWALTRASNKPLYAFALLWTSYSLSFGDSDSGHNIWGLVRDPFNWEE